LVDNAAGVTQFRQLDYAGGAGPIKYNMMWLALQHDENTPAGGAFPATTNRLYVPTNHVATYGGFSYGGGINTLFYDDATYYPNGTFPATIDVAYEYSHRDEAWVIGFGINA
jgi:hypothetical protein